MNDKTTKPTIANSRGNPAAGAPFRSTSAISEWTIAGLGLCMLLSAQFLLSQAIHHSDFISNDGEVLRVTVATAISFGGFLDVTNLNPLGGAGSLLQPLNVWANPAYWPLVMMRDQEQAGNLCALVALGCFAIGCYVMVRGFELPVVVSVVAVQCCIVLFAPTALILHAPVQFAFNPGFGPIYALQMAALGLLSRVEPSSWQRLGAQTGLLFVLLGYSVYCDPLWATVNGIAWSVPFAVVVFGSRKPKAILLRAAALGCSFVAFFAGGALAYLYALSGYTARVFFPAAIDRAHEPRFVSALAYSPNMKLFYLACFLGWLLGLVSLSGRPRLLVAAAMISFGCFVAYAIAFLVLANAPWSLPIPAYVEQGLFPLYLAAAVAGYWGALAKTCSAASRFAAGGGFASLAPAGVPALRRLAALIASILTIAAVPAAAASYALTRAGAVDEPYLSRPPDEPELGKFFADRLGLALGQPFRGSVLFWSGASWDGMVETDYARAILWPLGVPLLNDYSQLVTPQAIYMLDRLFQPSEKHYRNHFSPFASPERARLFWGAVQMLGARYAVNSIPLPGPYERGFPLVTLPHRPFRKEPGLWYVYELPHPNTGDYGPTEVVAAASASQMIAAMERADFDFAKTAVLSIEIRGNLVPASGVRLSLIRDGWHVSGRSDGTSLVVLPQQFSHCLRASDAGVRVLRADLMATALVFSGKLDTDLSFDFGLFSPLCRLADIRDARRLGMQVEYREPHLRGGRAWPDWHEAASALAAAARAFRLN